MKNQPLWLPKGSVRAILAIGLVGGGVAAAFLNKEASDALLPLGGAVVAYYFRDTRTTPPDDPA